MDGRILSTSLLKPWTRSSASATPVLVGVSYQKASSLWHQLIIGASEAPPKIPMAPPLGAGLARRSPPDLSFAMRRLE